MSPLSDEAQKLYHNSPALLFTATAQYANEQQTIDSIAELLGVSWKRADVDAMFAPTDPKERRTRKEKVFIPLLLGMQPKIQDFLKDTFGTSIGSQAPEWYTGDQDEMVEGWEMDRDAFVKIASIFTGHIPTDYLSKI